MVTEEKKKKAIRRLKSMYPLRAKVNESYLKGTEALKSGKPVVWGMLNYYYGDSELKALNVEVVYPENYGAALAAFGRSQKTLDIADAAGFPPHLCGYRRANSG